jgi:cysteine desulfurase / selenocysteine lyase
VTLDIEGLRAREFPWAARGDAIFLNHASTGPLPERARLAANDFNMRRAKPWEIPAELQFGTLARGRELCARLVGASTSEIAMMVNTTYGLNVAARALPFSPGDVVLTSDREFPSNIYPWMALQRSRGVELRVLPCAGRLPDEERLLRELEDPRVKGVVHSWVSFESGYRIDLATIGAACRERGIWFVVDAMQGVGAMSIDVHALNIDILACGAQKWLLGPWGSGFVYIREELARTLEPVEVSWMATRSSDDLTKLIEYDFTYREDARRFEMITLPYQDFAGMNAALELLQEVGLPVVYDRVRAHADRIMEWACARSDMTLVTPSDPNRRAGVIAVIPPHAPETSRRLSRANVIHSLREGAIRLSPHFYNTNEEIDRALEILSGS